MSSSEVDDVIKQASPAPREANRNVSCGRRRERATGGSRAEGRAVCVDERACRGGADRAGDLGGAPQLKLLAPQLVEAIVDAPGRGCHVAGTDEACAGRLV